jgi:hypothetical protein
LSGSVPLTLGDTAKSGMAIGLLARTELHTNLRTATFLMIYLFCIAVTTHDA